LLMGIVNVTPDSFSDGGQFLAPEAAADHALQLIDDGADLLDIGGESSRPGALPVPVDEELRRVIPVLDRLLPQISVPVSIDTVKSAVAQAALDRGVEIINDISGLHHDPRMVDLAARTAAGVCIMHMQGTPQTMQLDPHYTDVIREVRDSLKENLQRLSARGIDPQKICVDPGIGFGKTTAHNLELLRHIAEFHALGRPVLVGHSRKGFIGKITADSSAERTSGTLVVAVWLAACGVQIIRLHDVAPARQALAMFKALAGATGPAHLHH
jgi:dihydropteroate synthase